jgi:hypothetical protein
MLTSDIVVLSFSSSADARRAGPVDGRLSQETAALTGRVLGLYAVTDR